ncbi:MAG: hypothetical protein M3O50_14900 [Myxococcota bacterium]|nr:hypothetical protein [Myxococcota bacterium]
MSTAKIRVTASPDLQVAVRALIERDGVPVAAKILGISRMTVLSLACGASVQPATITHAESRISTR